MQYAKFSIPDNADGTVVTYSPGWCGTRDRCAQGEKGILYNDDERWGIMQFEGDFVPPDVQVLTEKEATALLATTSEKENDNPKVFYGEKLATRWEKQAEQMSVSATGTSAGKTVDYVAMGWCNECAKAYRWNVPVPVGLKCKDLAMTVICPKKHKCVVHIDTSEVENG